MLENGCVYLIADYDKEAYKIGVSKNGASRRLKQLQTGNSGELEIVHVFNTKHPFRMEKMLHARFMPNRIHNEWFSMTNSDVANFPKICKDVEACIEALKDNPFFSKNLN